jgi:hypothetical protein
MVIDEKATGEEAIQHYFLSGILHHNPGFPQ